MDPAPLASLNPERFDSPVVLKLLNRASRSLAELKGAAKAIPSQSILITTLGLREAAVSSEIENIVTTQDEVFQERTHPAGSVSPAAKEVVRYGAALQTGYELVRQTGLVTLDHLQEVHRTLMGESEGFRARPGTYVMNQRRNIIHNPPQEQAAILRSLRELQSFINNPLVFHSDPLIKLALIHHQFETIHPFYDGNGRTGRILNVLYLVKEKLLDVPILYLSGPILRRRSQYYSLLQEVRDHDRWEEWTCFMLECTAEAAEQDLQTVDRVSKALLEAKHFIRREHRFYSQDLLNHLFAFPYTRIEFFQEHMRVSRPTASKQLNDLAESGILRRVQSGRNVYFVNILLWEALSGASMPRDEGA